VSSNSDAPITLNISIPSQLPHSRSLAVIFFNSLPTTNSISITTIMAEETIDLKLFRYDPSMVAAVIFIILFLVITALHLY
jgi:hypothetical protein